MTDEKRVAIHVSKSTLRAVTAFAKTREVPIGMACDALILTALGRLAALARYVKKPQKRATKKK